MRACKKQSYSFNRHLPIYIKPRLWAQVHSYSFFFFFSPLVSPAPFNTHSKQVKSLRFLIKNSFNTLTVFLIYELCRELYRFDKNIFKDSVTNNQKLKILVLVSQWVSIMGGLGVIILDHQSCDCGREKGRTSSLSPMTRHKRMFFFFFLNFCSILPQSLPILFYI